MTAPFGTMAMALGIGLFAQFRRGEIAQIRSEAIDILVGLESE